MAASEDLEPQNPSVYLVLSWDLSRAKSWAIRSLGEAINCLSARRPKYTTKSMPLVNSLVVLWSAGTQQVI